MLSVTRIADLRKNIAQWRKQGQIIAFVPTMGHLHDGHIQLVSAARKQADKVVVSIFVNPTQFGEGEDYQSYPRTEQEDAEKLQAARVDVLFLPSVSEMYPHVAQVNVAVTGLSDAYCGASRPGHFNGVATVVCKLFNMVQPDLAFFGEKDFQQLAIIRQMADDLNMPVQICSVPIVREKDGLAMSSRNSYLTKEEREVAPRFYQALCQVRDDILDRRSDIQAIIEKQRQALRAEGFRPDYLAVCRASDLKEAGEDDRDLVVLSAVWLGTTRLIDNVRFFR